jgi:heme exporter protein CcmD
MMYLIPAYAFAVLVLGGYLAWSLRRLRELSRERTKRGSPK